MLYFQCLIDEKYLYRFLCPLGPEDAVLCALSSFTGKGYYVCRCVNNVCIPDDSRSLAVRFPVWFENQSFYAPSLCPRFCVSVSAPTSTTDNTFRASPLFYHFLHFLLKECRVSEVATTHYSQKHCFK